MIHIPYIIICNYLLVYLRKYLYSLFHKFNLHAYKLNNNSKAVNLLPTLGSVFAEAFITTFRTFITPAQLIEKLVQRYTLYCCQLHEQKAAKESFALLVRVVNDLT